MNMTDAITAHQNELPTTTATLVFTETTHRGVATYTLDSYDQHGRSLPTLTILGLLRLAEETHIAHAAEEYTLQTGKPPRPSLSTPAEIGGGGDPEASPPAETVGVGLSNSAIPENPEDAPTPTRCSP